MIETLSYVPGCLGPAILTKRMQGINTGSVPAKWLGPRTFQVPGLMKSALRGGAFFVASQKTSPRVRGRNRMTGFLWTNGNRTADRLKGDPGRSVAFCQGGALLASDRD